MGLIRLLSILNKIGMQPKELGGWDELANKKAGIKKCVYNLIKSLRKIKDEILGKLGELDLLINGLLVRKMSEPNFGKLMVELENVKNDNLLCEWKNV